MNGPGKDRNSYRDPAQHALRSGKIVWRNQDPPATDVLLDVTVPFSGGGTPAYLEIDKLANGRYRATVGTLFEFQELCRTEDLEALLRHTRAMQASRSFDEMVQASGLCTHWMIRAIDRNGIAAS